MALSTKTFYGKPKLRDSLRLEKLENADIGVISRTYPFQLLSVNSPTMTWDVFKRQNQALEFAKKRRNGVMTFVFHQELDGTRLFLVAHPLMFWHYDSQRRENRCSYEIIPENCVCKLYFDLEFSKELNPVHDGSKMTDVLIELVALYLLSIWNIKITRENVLDLDSSTDSKFSRHLIFQLPNAAFKDNYNVGNFIKMICRDLTQKRADTTCNPKTVDLDRFDINSLFVLNCRGEWKLFCDEGVYTKNRHFRLYRSSKWKQNSPLLLCSQNQFHIVRGCEMNSMNVHEDALIFLHSLISYIAHDMGSLKVLEYGDSHIQLPISSCCKSVPESSGDHSPSPHPEIDDFIKQIASPGRIHKWFYFSSGNCIVYNIIGYRYCHNIKREHRSNNIKYVVDINEGCFYQKCYDPECFGFRSEAVKLPDKLCVNAKSEKLVHFCEEELSRTFAGYFGLLEDEFVGILDVVESEETSAENNDETKFPEYGIPDSAFADICESSDNAV